MPKVHQTFEVPIVLIRGSHATMVSFAAGVDIGRAGR